MTPIGAKMRTLRATRGATLKNMAAAIGVSSAYLSALERGKRGRPGWHLIQRIVACFNIIWDDAEEVARLARVSHPRVVTDTGGLDPRATELANRLAESIASLGRDELERLPSAVASAPRQAAGFKE